MKNNEKNTRPKTGFPEPGAISAAILLIGLPVITGYLFCVAVYMRYFVREYIAFTLRTLPVVIEHILMSLLLIIGGAVVFDLLQRRR